MLYRDFRSNLRGLDDLLPYAYLLEDERDGVVLLKDGGFLASWRYSGPDLAAAEPEELAALSSHVNRALVSLGDGWMVHVDAVRTPATRYPAAGAFPDAVSWLIDEERREAYEAAGEHYRTELTWTVTYLPPAAVHSRVAALFVDDSERSSGVDWVALLRGFGQRLEQLEDALSARLTLRRLRGAELLGHLHACISGRRHDLRLPKHMTGQMLDGLLASREVIAGLRMKVGDQHVRVIGLTGYPDATFPSCLSALVEPTFEARWSVRFIPLDPQTAISRLDKYRRNWWAKRRGVVGLVREVLDKNAPSDAVTNVDAASMAGDADDAKAAASSGEVRFGFFTAVMVLMGSEETRLDEHAREVVKELGHRGFAAQVETMNALEAFLGSLPGIGHANVRKPLVSSLNVADVLPVMSVWAGRSECPSGLFPPRSPALLLANTQGRTPFALNLHVGDVGHTLVIGSTGTGKSVLLNFLAAQFRRYPGARVFFFDKGGSSKILARCMGGAHYDLGPDGGVSLAPLRTLDTDGDRLWAQSYVADLAVLQKHELEPADRDEITRAIARLAASPAEQRSLEELGLTLQSEQLRAVVGQYTRGSGRMINAEDDSLRESAYQVFETDSLMPLGNENVIPVLLYLFRAIARQLDGRPTLVIVDEAWSVMRHPAFRAQIEEWLRVLRKRNAAVVLATQTVQEIADSPLASVILENCPTKIFLPNARAQSTEISRRAYLSCGVSDGELRLITAAVPKREYLVLSPEGARVIDLALGPVALSFVGRTSDDDRARFARLREEYGAEAPGVWLEELGYAAWAKRWRDRAIEEEGRS